MAKVDRPHRILLAASASIALAKFNALIRCLIKSGFEVKVVLSTEACELVSLKTIETLTQSKVYVHDDIDVDSHQITHIMLAKWADAMVLAPATANTVAKLALGLGDHLIGSIYLAMTCPLLVAPAMNVHMWEHPMTQQHIGALRERGCTIIMPGQGEQACGDQGMGRMCEPEEMIHQIKKVVQGSTALSGKTVVVTAGATRDYLDPIRYISNNSSGKMGLALAYEACQQGAQVVLIYGPSCQIPAGYERLMTCVAVVTTAEMLKAVLHHSQAADIYMGVAAVNDFSPKHCADHKLDRHQGGLTVELQPNADIIKTVKQHYPDIFSLGFSADFSHDMAKAQRKREQKQCDLIFHNDVSQSDIGFNSDYNAGTLITAKEQIVIERAPKAVIAERIVKVLADYI